MCRVSYNIIKTKFNDRYINLDFQWETQCHTKLHNTAIISKTLAVDIMLIQKIENGSFRETSYTGTCTL